MPCSCSSRIKRNLQLSIGLLIEQLEQQKEREPLDCSEVAATVFKENSSSKLGCLPSSCNSSKKRSLLLLIQQL